MPTVREASALLRAPPSGGKADGSYPGRVHGPDVESRGGSGQQKDVACSGRASVLKERLREPTLQLPAGDDELDAGLRVYCEDGSGKRTYATLRFDEVRGSFVCSMEDEDDMVTDYSVRDFCLIAGSKPNPSQRADANGDRAASVPSAFAEQLISAGNGAPVDWNKLERETRLRVHMPSGHSGTANGSRHGGHPSSSGGGETGGGSRRSSGAARSAVHARGAGGSASTKRRRDGGGNDSDSDGETTWAKALKQSEYLERLEKTETFKQRRMAEQAALNQRFFVTSRKKEEPVLGVDVNAPLLPEGMFSALDDFSVLEKGKAVHSRLVEKGEETEEDRLKHQQWVARYKLAEECLRLQKVSREFEKSGTIHVNMYKVAHTAEDNYDAVVTKKWNEDFQSVPWFKMPKMEAEMPPPSLNTPRNRTVSGSSTRGNSGRGDLATGMGYGGDLNAVDTDEMDMGSILYQPSLHAEERQLLEALFACYGPDPRTICRLLCRPDASLEVQELVAEAASDIRCEVCRNPEAEDQMILCDNCDKGYHIFCLDPPLAAIPDGDWFCEHCTSAPASRANLRAPQECVYASQTPKSSTLAPHGTSDSHSLQLRGLEVEAQEELRQSVAEGEWNKIIKSTTLLNSGQVQSNSKPRETRLTMEEIQQCPNTSIFSAILFTCPVPTRTENKPMAEIVTIPLRRHLRIIATAVKRAFTDLQVIAVRRALGRRAAGLPPVVDEQKGRRGWVIQMSPQLIDVEACARKEGAISVLLRRHAQLIKPGDRVYIWKTGSVKLTDGVWEPVDGGLVAFGHVRGAAEIQALPAAMAAHLRPAGNQLDPWKHVMSCTVVMSHVLQETLMASKLRMQLHSTSLPIFENAVGSVYRLTTAQIVAVEEILQRHDPSIPAEAFGSMVGSSSGRGQYYNMFHQTDRKDKPAASVQRRFLNKNTQESSEESDGNDLFEEGDENLESRKPMWINQGEQLLTRLKRLRDAWPFIRPVNTALYPDYNEVLHRHGCSPISLADIEENLLSGLYRNHKEFLADINRIWKNCQVYNPPKDPMQLMATNMSQETDLLWANFKKHRNKRRRALEGERYQQEDENENAIEAASAEPTPSDPMESTDEGKHSLRRSEGAVKETSTKSSGVTTPAEEPCGDKAPMLKCQVCNVAEQESEAKMVICSASGQSFHLSCLKEPPLQLLDGPFISPHMLKGLEEWQLPRAPGLPDNQQVTAEGRPSPCRLCKEWRPELPVQCCAGCIARYHTQCLASQLTPSEKTRQAQDKCWLCAKCQDLLPPPKRCAQMLCALVRRELVWECRRLIHLHCELCSRDRELDMERELHRFRILKQTSALAKRIFDYNALLMKEANELLSQTYNTIAPA